jgi:hypothetical protein
MKSHDKSRWNLRGRLCAVDSSQPIDKGLRVWRLVPDFGAPRTAQADDPYNSDGSVK